MKILEPGLCLPAFKKMATNFCDLDLLIFLLFIIFFLSALAYLGKGNFFGSQIYLKINLSTPLNYSKTETNFIMHF
jgi:hypothetical protein